MSNVTYVKGQALHKTLTDCMNILQTHADQDGIGDRKADTVMCDNISGMTIGAARMFRSELIALGHLEVESDAYIVTKVTEVVTPEETTELRKRLYKSRIAVKNATKASPVRVAEDELERAYHALLANCTPEGVSPHVTPATGRKSARSVIKVTLGIPARRATTLLEHLVKSGRAERIERSSSVRVIKDVTSSQEENTADEPDQVPSLSSVTYRELRQAIMTLYGENQQLKQRVSDLEAEVATLHGRVTSIENAEIDPELRAILREVEIDQVA